MARFSYAHSGASVPLSIIDAADDLIVGTGDNTAGRLAVAASRIIGKKATGGLAALTADEIDAILGLAGWFKIAETTLGADAASIDFQNIPQTFTHLVAIARVRSARAAVTSDTLQMSVNNSTVDANYSRQLLRSNGATTTSTEAIGVAGSRAVALIPAVTATANHVSRSEVLIPGYAGTANVKGVLSRNVVSLGMTTGLIYVEHNTTIFNSTNAIDRLTFTPLVGPNLLAGSVISLYGILGGV